MALEVGVWMALEVGILAVVGGVEVEAKEAVQRARLLSPTRIP